MKIVIVGAGIAGLSAGIYAKKSGYEVEIYEKNPGAGGCCSAWKRGDYTIDNCIHWLTGTKKGTPQYNIWKELGVIKDDDVFIERESFYTSEYEGKCATLWRDLERTRKEMLEISPEDEKEINRFIDCIRLGVNLQSPADDPSGKKKVFKDTAYSISRAELIRTLLTYTGQTLEDMSHKIKSPLLKMITLDFMSKNYESLWLAMAYSFFVAGNGDLLPGGSAVIPERMVETFTGLGGKLFLNSPVEKVSINEKNDFSGHGLFRKKKYASAGVFLEDGRFIEADYIICACDMHYTFCHLLNRKFYPESLRKAYSNNKKNIIYSSFHVAFAVDGLFEEINDTIYFDCEPFDVGLSRIRRICVKNYRNYGDYIAPEGKTIIQCSVIQYKRDAFFWQRLHDKDENIYRLNKENVARAIQYRIEKKYPQYSDRLHILDTWTPYTYRKRNNCHAGAYMRFITKVVNTKAFLPSDIKGLSNVLLANHWLRYPGGTPTAALMGKVAVERITALESKNDN